MSSSEAKAYDEYCGHKTLLRMAETWFPDSASSVGFLVTITCALQPKITRKIQGSLEFRKSIFTQLRNLFNSRMNTWNQTDLCV